MPRGCIHIEWPRCYVTIASRRPNATCRTCVRKGVLYGCERVCTRDDHIALQNALRKLKRASYAQPKNSAKMQMSRRDGRCGKAAGPRVNGIESKVNVWAASSQTIPCDEQAFCDAQPVPLMLMQYCCCYCARWWWCGGRCLLPIILYVALSYKFNHSCNSIGIQYNVHPINHAIMLSLAHTHTRTHYRPRSFVLSKSPIIFRMPIFRLEIGPHIMYRLCSVLVKIRTQMNCQCKRNVRRTMYKWKGISINEGTGSLVLRVKRPS